MMNESIIDSTNFNLEKEGYQVQKALDGLAGLIHIRPLANKYGFLLFWI